MLRSPAGETRATLHFPFDKQQLETRLEGLAEGLAVQDFGKALFDALISGEARSLYDVSLAKAAESHKGLRVKLRIASPALAALPGSFSTTPGVASTFAFPSTPRSFATSSCLSRLSRWKWRLPCASSA